MASDQPSRTDRSTEARSARVTLEISLRTLAVVAAAFIAVATVVGASFSSIVVVGPVGAGLLVGIVLLAVHQERRARRAIAEPLADLAQAASSVSQGANLPIPVAGPAEVRSVAGAVDRLAQLTRALHERVEVGQQLLGQRDRQLASYRGEQQWLSDTAQNLSASFAPAAALTAVADAALEVTGLPQAVLWLLEPEGLVVHYDSAAENPADPGRATVPLGRGRVGEAAAKQTLVTQPAAPTVLDQWPAVAVPLLADRRCIGVVELLGDPAGDLSPRTRRLLNVVAIQGAVVLEAVRLAVRERELTRPQVASGLPGREQLLADVEVELERSRRYARPLAVVVGGIDGASRLASRLGRRGSEELLLGIGSVFAEHAREADGVYRLDGQGDQNFAVVTREVGGAGALVMARRLGDLVATFIEEQRPSAAATISFGVADVQVGRDGDDTLDPTVLLDRATGALEAARAAGGGCARRSEAEAAEFPSEQRPAAAPASTSRADTPTSPEGPPSGSVSEPEQQTGPGSNAGVLSGALQR